MEVHEYEALLNDVDKKLDRVRALYEQWFRGIEKLEPTVLRKEIDRGIDLMRHEKVRNTGLRFRFNTLVQRYTTYRTYWGRIIRQIEEGTYKRDLIRARRILGNGELDERDATLRPPHTRAGEVDLDADTTPPSADADEDVDTLPPAPERRPPPAAPVVLESESDYPPLPEAFHGQFAFGSAGLEKKRPRAAPPDPSSAPKSGPLREKAPPLAGPTEPPEAPRPPVVPTPSRAPAPRPPVPPATSVSPGPRPPVPPRASVTPGLRPPVPPATSVSPGPRPPTPAQPTAPPAPRAQPNPQPRAAAGDGDLRHVYEKYLEARRRNNESVEGVSYEKVAKGLKHLATKLEERHKGKRVGFDVEIRNGRVGFKPIPK